MSDGPYRSLPMSRSWKRLAEFAENVNFGGAEMSAAALNALKKAWRKGVPNALMTGFCKVFLEPQPGLFPHHCIEDVKSLSGLAEGHGLGRLLIDHAAMVVHEGRSGEAGLIEATQRTLAACGARASRQIEEHYLRKAPLILVRQVRERVRQALSDADPRALARQLCGLDVAAARRPSRKHKDLDDGVPL